LLGAVSRLKVIAQHLTLIDGGPAQVVAALNPIAGEKMQHHLEERIEALQAELEKAHQEVMTPPKKLPSCMHHPQTSNSSGFL
jgi:hypothetical protein